MQCAAQGETKSFRWARGNETREVVATERSACGGRRRAKRFVGVAGDDVDDAADGFGSVERAAGPADDLDAFDVLDTVAFEVHGASRRTGLPVAVDEDQGVFRVESTEADRRAAKGAFELNAPEVFEGFGGEPFHRRRLDGERVRTRGDGSEVEGSVFARHAGLIADTQSGVCDDEAEVVGDDTCEGSTRQLLRAIQLSEGR